jgi:very-short-patch-repair endonuclease
MSKFTPQPPKGGIEYQDGRSDEMEKYCIKVIRFTNKEIEYNIDHVNKLIEYEVQGRIQSPPWGI